MKSILILGLVSFFLLHCTVSGPALSGDQRKEAVWNTILEHHRAWAELEDIAALSLFVHDRVVIITPDAQKPITGKKAYLASYQQFITSADVVSLENNNPEVRLFCDRRCAVVMCEPVLTFSMGSDTLTWTGRDMFTLVKEKDRWLIASDQYSPFPKSDY